MKKLILAVVAVMAFGTTNAQNAKFGLKAGLNFATWTDAEAQNRTGLHIGGLVDINISKKFSIQPELLYSVQGYKLTYNGTAITVTMNYLNIPVTAKIKTGDKFNIELGPQFGILLDATGIAGNNPSVDIIRLFKTLDVGINLGASYDIDKNSFLAFRYNIGVGGLAKNLQSGQTDSNHRVISISYGYKFD
jgi:hypothetical protein